MKPVKPRLLVGSIMGMAVLLAGLTCFVPGPRPGGRWFHRWQLLWGRRSERG